MVVFDASMLLLLLSPNAAAPLDSNRKPIALAKERIDHLVAELESSRTKIVVPTPAISEILVRAGAAGPAYLERLSRSAAFRIVPFDLMAAVEVASMTREALDAGDKRAEADGTWAKIKYDRQIVAIAKTQRATIIYSDDENIKRFGAAQNLKVIGVGELPPPAATLQASLALEEPVKNDKRP